METVKLEEAVYEALKNDADLIALLAKGEESIFHLQAPSDLKSRYPALVYSSLSDTPSLSGDDLELTHTVSIRIHVITLDGDYGSLYRYICRDMEGLGFSRFQAYPYKEDGEIILISDFRIGVSAEWQR